MKFQITFNNNTCYYQINDTAHVLTYEQKLILNRLIQNREDRDFDFLSDVSVFPSKKLSAHYVEFISRSSLTVLDIVENYLNNQDIDQDISERINFHNMRLQEIMFDDSFCEDYIDEQVINEIITENKRIKAMTDEAMKMEDERLSKLEVPFLDILKAELSSASLNF